MTRNASQPKHRAGFALVLVLWATALLTVIGMSFALGVRDHTSLASNFVERGRADALASSGVSWALAGLLHKGEAFDQSQRLRADATPYVLRLSSGTVEVSVMHEAGKINVNLAPEELIVGLQNALNASTADGSSWADKLLDWRDEDSNTRTDGAEDQDYSSMGRSYGARDAPLQSLAELGQILGVTPELQRRLAALFTIHSPGHLIDPSTASLEVLLALPGLTQGSVEQYLRQRADNESAARALLQPASRYLLADGPGIESVYAIDAIATTHDGASVSRQAIVRIEPDGYHILAWRSLAAFTRDDSDADTVVEARN